MYQNWNCLYCSIFKCSTYLNVFLIFFINLEYIAAFFFFSPSLVMASFLAFDSPLLPTKKMFPERWFFWFVFVFNSFNVEMFKKQKSINGVLILKLTVGFL